MTTTITSDDASTESVFLGERSTTPTDSEYNSGEVAVYVKTDGNVYKRPHDGTETEIGGGALKDQGTDFDGGDEYGLPNPADNITLKGSGSVTDVESIINSPAQIDNTDSPYTTGGEDEIQVDTSSGSVTVTLASADLASGREIKIIDSGLNAGTNNITIETEGTETINPGSNSSISISIDGGYEEFFGDRDNWFSSRNRDTATIDSLNGTSADYDLVNTGEASITNETLIRPDRGSNTPDTAAGTFINAFDREITDNRDEFNASAQFSPDKSGIYIFHCVIQLLGTAGDQLEFKVHNVTDDTYQYNIARVQSPSTPVIPIALFAFLDSAKTYEVQATNNDSTFSIRAANTQGLIRGSVIQ